MSDGELTAITEPERPGGAEGDSRPELGVAEFLPHGEGAGLTHELTLRRRARVPVGSNRETCPGVEEAARGREWLAEPDRGPR